MLAEAVIPHCPNLAAAESVQVARLTQAAVAAAELAEVPVEVPVAACEPIGGGGRQMMLRRKL